MPRRRTARRRCTRRCRRDKWRSFARWSPPAASFDATNKDNLTPLQLAEKPEPRRRRRSHSGSWRLSGRKRDTREEVIAALRELMKLGPDDPDARAAAGARAGRAEDKKEREEGSRAMKSVLVTARARLGGAAVLLAQSASARACAVGSPQSAQPVARAAGAVAVTGGRERPEAPGLVESGTASAVITAARHRQPNDPVNLESASLDDLLPHAATWERVLRKLSVRAMPPQGMPHPTEPEYVGVHQLAGRIARSRLGRGGALRAATWCIA